MSDSSSNTNNMNNSEQTPPQPGETQQQPGGQQQQRRPILLSFRLPASVIFGATSPNTSQSAPSSPTTSRPHSAPTSPASSTPTSPTFPRLPTYVQVIVEIPAEAIDPTAFASATPTSPSGQPMTWDDFLSWTFQQQQQQNQGPPPASKTIEERLPAITITADSLKKQHNCPVCQLDYQVGEGHISEKDTYTTQDGQTQDEKIVQLECSHFFHSSCILPWLATHNTCPLCRWELETDDANYEIGRKKRMEERRVKEAEQAEKLKHDAWLKMYPCELGKIRGTDCMCDDSKKLVQLEKCGHQFHAECVEGWRKITHMHPGDEVQCPRCRQESRVVDLKYDKPEPMDVDATATSGVASP